MNSRIMAAHDKKVFDRETNQMATDDIHFLKTGGVYPVHRILLHIPSQRSTIGMTYFVPQL